MTLPIQDDAASAASGLIYDDQGGNAPTALTVRWEDQQIIMQRPEAPAFAQFSTYLPDATFVPQQILAQAPKRKRAIIKVSNSLVDNSAVGFVVVGTLSQVQNVRPNVFNSGGIMVSGDMIEYTGSSPLYLASDGVNALTVTVLDERYQ